jgi:hypothetical protein
MALPADYKEKLVEELKKRGFSQCEVCGKNNWSVVDQAVGLTLTDLSPGFRIPSPQIPCAGMVCNNCGNIRTLALGVLNMLPMPVTSPTTPPKDGGQNK